MLALLHRSRVEIDSDQRWLVRPRDKARIRLRRDHGETPQFELVVGEVSGSGKWFKIKESCRDQWYSVNDYDWLEQLI